MNELPRRRIEPLQPQPGQFEMVLGRARYRRHRRVTTVLTVSAVFLAGVAGGLGLGGQRVQDIVTSAADQLRPPSTATETADGPANSAKATPKHGKAKDKAGKGAPVVVVPTPASRGMLALRGRAVGAAGQPAAGLYIYPGRPGYDRYVPTRYAVGRTAADGSFSMSCPGTPVLLSPWPVNAEAKAKARAATWGATFVGGATDPTTAGDAPCSRNGRVVDTVVQKGSAVAGTVSMPSACEDEALPLWVWLYNDRSVTVRLQDLHDGDSFRAGGLPPGQHTLGANGHRTKVTVGGGETLPYDVTFSCEPGTPPEPVETSTPPASIPTPTDTLTPLPTGHPTTGSPSNTSTSSSSTSDSPTGSSTSASSGP